MFTVRCITSFLSKCCLCIYGFESILHDDDYMSTSQKVRLLPVMLLGEFKLKAIVNVLTSHVVDDFDTGQVALAKKLEEWDIEVEERILAVLSNIFPVNTSG